VSVRWENRRREPSAIWALVLICALAISAGATQTSTDNSAKPTTAKTTPKHKTTSSSSATKSSSSSKTHTASSKTSSRRRKKSAKVRGQQKIDSERAQAIQEALIRQHYLTGEATGTWNDASEAAMRRFQASTAGLSPGFGSSSRPRRRGCLAGLGGTNSSTPSACAASTNSATRSRPGPCFGAQ